MNFKYYDILSLLVMGYIVLMIFMNVFEIHYDNADSVLHLAFAFIVGYFINTLSSLLEDFFYWTIGGMPSNKLLKIDPNKRYTGIRKVKFYQAQKVIEMLKIDVDDVNASEGKMFGRAMRISSGNEKSRVPDFNAHYALSRTVLTVMLIISGVLIIHYYGCWKTYLIIIPLLLAWERYRERGYYFAREVLNEYLKCKEQ